LLGEVKLWTKARFKQSGYNPQTGRPTGRAIGALERLEELIARFVAEGM